MKYKIEIELESLVDLEKIKTFIKDLIGDYDFITLVDLKVEEKNIQNV